MSETEFPTQEKMREIVFENNEWYHIYNRGVEKRKIFLEDEDCFRFACHLYEFNDTKLNSDVPFQRRKHKIIEKIVDVGNSVSDTRDKLVDIVAWSVLPNHFHLLIKQLKDGGISLFLHRLGIGYTKGFNKKYDRVGALFQGAFRAKLIDSDEYFRYLLYYILLNPLEIFDPQWKEAGIKDYKMAKNFLESYKWSAYPDLINNINLPGIINKNFIKELFDDNEFNSFINDLMVSETEFPTFSTADIC